MPQSRRWRLSPVTAIQVTLLAVVTVLAGYMALTTVAAPPARAQGPGGPPFGGGGGFGFGGGERKVVSQFDKNGDQRLDNAERKVARESMAANPGRGGFRRGGGMGVAGSPGRKVAVADVKPYANAPLYDTATLRTIFLTFENDDWEQELAAFHNTDVEVPATAVIDGKTYPNVGVHFRGASSYMMVSEGSKRSLNLTFDYVDPKQEIGGYRTLNLLNGNGDPTFVRTVLFSEIARKYIPAPKTNYVRVVINGESWGVYMNAQQFNKDFTRDFYKSTKGARWKVPGRPGGRAGMEYLGDDPASYKQLYEIKTKDDAKSWNDLIRMFKVLNETPADKLEAALNPILDVDGVLRFLALDVALVNSDGYWTRASDYSIYQDEKGRFHVIPHDMNEGLSEGGFGPPGFGPGGGPGGPPPGFGPGGPGGPPPPPPGFGGGPGGQGRRGGRGMMGGASAELDPLVGLTDDTKPLRSKLLAVPALKERYLAYVRDIAEKHLDWKTLGPRVAELQAVIAEEVTLDTRKLYSTEAFKTGTDGPERSLKTFVEKRRAYLLK